MESNYRNKYVVSHFFSQHSRKKHLSLIKSFKKVIIEVHSSAKLNSMSIRITFIDYSTACSVRLNEICIEGYGFNESIFNIFNNSFKLSREKGQKVRVLSKMRISR